MVGTFAQPEAAENWVEDRDYVWFLAGEEFRGGDWLAGFQFLSLATCTWSRWVRLLGCSVDKAWHLGVFRSVVWPLMCTSRCLHLASAAGARHITDSREEPTTVILLHRHTIKPISNDITLHAYISSPLNPHQRSFQEMAMNTEISSSSEDREEKELSSRNRSTISQPALPRLRDHWGRGQRDCKSWWTWIPTRKPSFSETGSGSDYFTALVIHENYTRSNWKKVPALRKFHEVASSVKELRAIDSCGERKSQF